MKKLYISMLLNNMIGIGAILFLFTYNSLNLLLFGGIILLYVVSILIQLIYLINYDEDKKVFHSISIGLIVFLMTTLYISFPRDFEFGYNVSYLLFLFYLVILIIHLFIVHLHEDAFS